MKTHFEVKSILLGMTVGLGAFLLLGASGVDSANQTGRYQIATGGGFALVIDTSTGKVWGANLSGANFNTVQEKFWDAKN